MSGESFGAGRTDPRKLGGDIIGGTPYGEGDAGIVTENAVLMDGVSVAIVGGIRKGVLDPKPRMALALRGRINKTQDRTNVLYLMDEDGAAAIVTEVIGASARAGFGPAFMERIAERMKEMPT